jgi:hypothetical protein
MLRERVAMRVFERRMRGSTSEMVPDVRAKTSEMASQNMLV